MAATPPPEERDSTAPEESGADDGEGDGDTTSRPHWFFVALLIPVVLGAVGAAEANGTLPRAALGSRALYRTEIFVILFVLGFVVTLLLAFAYFGNAPRKVVLPGGTERASSTAGWTSRTGCSVTSSSCSSVRVKMRTRGQVRARVGRLILRRPRVRLSR